MFNTLKNLRLTQKFYRRTTSCFVIFALVALIFSNNEFKSQAQSSESAAPQAVFTNPAAITIPSSGPATPSYPSAITASGLPASIPATPGSVKVTLNGFSHTFPDDVGILLVGPTGAALNISDGAGDGIDMVGITFTISDDGATQLPNNGAWTAGTYKPAAYYTDNYPAPGPGLVYGNPGPVAGGTATFSSVFGGTNPNGVWNLYIVDFVGGDSGSVSGGWSLEIAGAVVAASDAPVDFNGDGRTDYAVARNVGGGPSGQLRWFYNLNNSANPTVSLDWGLNSDAIVPADYDGDQKDDVAVWRPGAATIATFYILQSQTNTLRQEAFGQTGDNPTVVGDYNGDGKDDVAVYRPGAIAGAQSTWFYRTTPNGAVTFVQWGLNGDFAAPGDFDNDGKNDFAIQRNDGGGQARFWRLFSNLTTDTVVFGLISDSIITGDFDGDNKTDIAVSRNSGGVITWYWRPSGGGADQQVTFGLSGDTLAPGDYDGDGKTDTAVWRSGQFITRGTTSGIVSYFGLGASGDRVPALYNVH